MSLKAEVRECPTTYGLAAAWCLVYAAMSWQQGGFRGGEVTLTGLGSVSPATTHLFGDLTWRDVSRGQVWRPITATFVHYSLPHLVTNLIGMIQLGRLMEDWYGSRQFLAICLGLGGLGNLLGLLMRQGVAHGRLWLQARGVARVLPDVLAQGFTPEVTANIPAGGGSTVILGLIGLALVVGWRSRTRVGSFLRNQMLGFLVFTAVIGIVGAKFIDNYGHAGGAISGSLLGFLHRRLVRTAERGPARRLAGLASAAVLVGCALGQSLAARTDLDRARRASEAERAILVAGTSEELRLRLFYLGDAAGRLATSRSRGGIDRALRAADPSQLGPVDLTSLMEAPPTRPAPPGATRGTEAAEAAVVGRMIEELAALRPRLDPRLAGPELEAVMRIGGDLATGAVESRDLYRFAVDWRDLERRSEAVRDEAKARAVALGVEFMAR